MIKYFGRAFKITNENIILTTPLVLFLLLLSIYLGVAQNAPANAFSAILLLITILLMVAAFFAGWLYMVKKAIELNKREFIIDEDKAKASFNLIKEVPVGIGEYFFPIIGALVLYSGFFLLVFFIAFQIGMHFIGNVGVDLAEIKVALGSTAALKSLVSSLSTEQLTKLNTWNFLFMGVMGVYSFITMFWSAQIIMKNKNPFVSFFQSVKFTFQNFLGSVVLFAYISVINFGISLLNAFSVVNQIVYFVSMLVYFYFVVYVVVLVFLYYDSENNKRLNQGIEKQIEGTVEGGQECNCASEDNCDCGSNGVGEEQSGDSDSKKD